MFERSESRSSSRNSDRDRANIVTGVRTIRIDSSRDNKTSNSSGKNYSSNGSNRNNTITGVKTIVMDNRSSKPATNTSPKGLVTGVKTVVMDNRSSKPATNTSPKGLVTGVKTIVMDNRSSKPATNTSPKGLVTGVKTVVMDNQSSKPVTNTSPKGLVTGVKTIVMDNHSSKPVTNTSQKGLVTGVKTVVMDNHSSKPVTNTSQKVLVTGVKTIVMDNQSSKPVTNTSQKVLVTGVKTIVMDKPNSAALPTYKPTSHTIAKINYFTHKILESTKSISIANTTSQPPHTVKQIERLTKELEQLIAKDESQKKIDVVINNIKFYSNAMNSLNRSISNDIFTTINHISTTLKQNNLNNITSSQINKQPPNITNTVSTLVTNNLPKLKLTAEEARALAMDASYATVVDKNNNLLPQRGIENILQQMFNNESKEKLFNARFEILAQLPNTQSGASAVLIKDKETQKKALVVRGTEISFPAVVNDSATLAQLVYFGRAAEQERDLINFYQRLTAPKGQSFSVIDYPSLPIVKPGVTKNIHDIKVTSSGNIKGLGLLSKNESLEFWGHSLGKTLADALHHSTPNPSVAYGINGAGHRQSNINKDFYEKVLKVTSGTPQKIDWEKQNVTSTNLVTTGFPTIAASHNLFIQQNGNVIRQSQPLNGLESHKIGPFTNSTMIKTMVELTGNRYEDLVRKYKDTAIKENISRYQDGWIMGTEIPKEYNYEKMIINNTASYFGESRRYIDNNASHNSDLLIDLRKKVNNLNNLEKKALEKHLNDPQKIRQQALELLPKETSSGFRSRSLTQADQLRQAMTILNSTSTGLSGSYNISSQHNMNILLTSPAN